MKVLLLLSYHGKRYHGFQRQNQDLPTVQKEIETVLEKIYSNKITILASGRTDKGVHADGQVITFIDHDHLTLKISFKKLPQIINQKLPPDIHVFHATKVDDHFHVRYDARVRWYRYQILLTEKNKQRLGVNLEQWTPVDHPIEQDILTQCFAIFKGKKNFSSFCSARDSSSNKVRTIYQVELFLQENRLWIDLFANAFLQGMVRSIVGNILYLYHTNQRKKFSHDHTLDQLKQILKKEDPCFAKHRAPPQGLILKKVFYQPIFDEPNEAN